MRSNGGSPLPDTIFEVIYLVGLIAAEALRLPQRKRHWQDRKQNRITDSRVIGVETLLLPLILR